MKLNVPASTPPAPAPATTLFARAKALTQKWVNFALCAMAVFSAVNGLAAAGRQRNGALVWTPTFADPGCPVPFFDALAAFAASSGSLTLVNYLNSNPTARVCTNATQAELLGSIGHVGGVEIYDPIEYAGAALDPIQRPAEPGTCSLRSLATVAAQCSPADEAFNCTTALLTTPPAPSGASAGLAWLYNLEQQGKAPTCTLTVTRIEAAAAPCPHRYVWSVRQDSLLGYIASFIVFVIGVRLLLELCSGCCTCTVLGHPRFVRQCADVGMLGAPIEFIHASPQCRDCKCGPRAPQTTAVVFYACIFFDLCNLLMAVTPFLRGGGAGCNVSRVGMFNLRVGGARARGARAPPAPLPPPVAHCALTHARTHTHPARSAAQGVFNCAGHPHPPLLGHARVQHLHVCA